jgi:hypothetical protein
MLNRANTAAITRESIFIEATPCDDRTLLRYTASDLNNLKKWLTPGGSLTIFAAFRASSGTNTVGRAPAQSSWLLDHVVGTSEHQWRHDKTQSLGSPEIDDQFILRGKLRW